MANLIKRENRDVTRSASPEHRLDPFRMMDALLRWEPFRGEWGGFSQTLDFAPRFDVKETKDAYVINADLPGVKDEELEGIRARIDDVRTRAHVDADAAQRLQGLLAYETRIAAAPEWPFDETTLMRLGASALILTVPWFGQAIAAYLIERLGPG